MVVNTKADIIMVKLMCRGLFLVRADINSNE